LQTPAPVDYARATSVEHALELLEKLGPESRLIAGGHSLLPMMRLRLAQPETVIDINGLTDLDYIRVEEDELRIGAMTRHAAVLASPVVGEHYAILHDAERRIADPPVRNRGTVGGSFCQADPAEDLSAVGSALKAVLVLRSAQGTRTMPARDFHAGPYETALRDAEMLTEVRIPIRPGAGSAYEKVKRKAGDWAIAGAGAFVVLRDGNVAVANHHEGAGAGDRPVAGLPLDLLVGAARAGPDRDPHLGEDLGVGESGLVRTGVELPRGHGACPLRGPEHEDGLER